MRVLNAGKTAMGEHGANYKIGNVKEVLGAVSDTHKLQNNLKLLIYKRHFFLSGYC